MVHQSEAVFVATRHIQWSYFWKSYSQFGLLPLLVVAIATAAAALSILLFILCPVSMCLAVWACDEYRMCFFSVFIVSGQRGKKHNVRALFRDSKFMIVSRCAKDCSACGSGRCHSFLFPLSILKKQKREKGVRMNACERNHCPFQRIWVNGTLFSV